jgi:hypothetical protein
LVLVVAPALGDFVRPGVILRGRVIGGLSGVLVRGALSGYLLGEHRFAIAVDVAARRLPRAMRMTAMIVGVEAAADLGGFRPMRVRVI